MFSKLQMIFINFFCHLFVRLSLSLLSLVTIKILQNIVTKIKMNNLVEINGSRIKQAIRSVILCKR